MHDPMSDDQQANRFSRRNLFRLAGAAAGATALGPTAAALQATPAQAAANTGTGIITSFTESGTTGSSILRDSRFVNYTGFSGTTSAHASNTFSNPSPGVDFSPNWRAVSRNYAAGDDRQLLYVNPISGGGVRYDIVNTGFVYLRQYRPFPTFMDDLGADTYCLSVDIEVQNLVTSDPQTNYVRLGNRFAYQYTNADASEQQNSATATTFPSDDADPMSWARGGRHRYRSTFSIPAPVKKSLTAYQKGSRFHGLEVTLVVNLPRPVSGVRLLVRQFRLSQSLTDFNATYTGSYGSTGGLPAY